MAKNYNNEEGHWVTTKDGKHVFIKEDLVDKQEREIKEQEEQTKQLTEEKNGDVIVARLPGKNYVTISSVDDLFKKWGFQRDSNFIKGNLAYSWSRHEDNPNFNRYSVHIIDDYGNVNGFVGRYVVGNTQYNVQAMVDDAEKKVAKWAKKKAVKKDTKQSSNSADKDFDQLDKDIISRELATLSDSYKKSPNFKQPTVKDALDNDLLSAYNDVKNALKYKATYGGGVDLKDAYAKYIKFAEDMQEDGQDYEAWFYRQLAAIIRKNV